MEKYTELEKELHRREFVKCLERNIHGKRNAHNYRLWLDSDNGKAICGNCGTFIYRRKKNWKDIVAWFHNFFGKICLACLVEKASETRRDMFGKELPPSLLNHNHNLRCNIQRNIIYWKYRLKC